MRRLRQGRTVRRQGILAWSNVAESIGQHLLNIVSMLLAVLSLYSILSQLINGRLRATSPTKTLPVTRRIEPKRDWSWGPLTGHRLRVVTYMTLAVISLYWIQALLWPQGQAPQSSFERIWNWGTLLWMGALLPGILGLLGALSFRHAEDLDGVLPIPQLVSWRIVSRGTNVEALTATILRCQQEMAETPLFPYIIEVVTDHISAKFPPANENLVYLHVPTDYQTSNRSLYKARALQYALEHSTLPDNAWIVHLDEETRPTSSGIKGIARMIRQEEEAGTLRIGQGTILYHRDWHKHPFLTLADNIRTGDDFARFHFQHLVGITIFGLHGSFIVVRNDVEKAGGFDFGPPGSITEDAFWSLVSMEKGIRCRWVDGYLEEQSTQGVGDFVRQRRRWFQGLVKVVLQAPVKLRWRISLGVNTILWSLAPFAALYTVAHLFYGSVPDPWIRFLANASFCSFIMLYLIGLRANLDEHGITNMVSRARWMIVQVILVPFFTLLEGTGVMMALLKPVDGFHIVKK